MLTSTTHPISKELQQAACDNFQQLGGTCVEQSIYTAVGHLNGVASGRAFLPRCDLLSVLRKTDTITKAIRKPITTGPDEFRRLISQDFLQKPTEYRRMYLSDLRKSVNRAFSQKYKARYGEDPSRNIICSLRCGELLFNRSRLCPGRWNNLYIQRQNAAMLLHITRRPGFEHGNTCSSDGDCARQY